jgi:flagellar motor switch protein FliG
MSHLGTINDDVMRDIGQTLREEFEAMGSFETGNEGIDGQATAVEILKCLQQEYADQLIEELAYADDAFAQELRSKLFIFEDLGRLDPRTMQRLLREVDSKLLSVALKGADTLLQDAFFGAMSSRASEMLRDDMDASGPMRIADVETAQSDIVEIAMQLEADGLIVLPRGGADGLV